jgi:hypothetical protein
LKTNTNQRVRIVGALSVTQRALSATQRALTSTVAKPVEFGAGEHVPVEWRSLHTGSTHSPLASSTMLPAVPCQPRVSA